MNQNPIVPININQLRVLVPLHFDHIIVNKKNRLHSVAYLGFEGGCASRDICMHENYLYHAP